MTTKLLVVLYSIIREMQVISHAKSGRSRLIPKEQIEFFVEYGFKATDIAKILCVSVKIVHRRLHEYNLSIKKSYTCLSDEELDSTVLAISSQFNNCGYKAMRGHLGVKGVKINFMCVCMYVCRGVQGARRRSF